MEAIDANEYLIQFLGSIDNLPSEIHYHFSELTNKDQEIEQLTERIDRRKRRLWNLYDGLPIDEDSDCSVVENFDSLFPQHNLRDSSTSTPASPGRVDSSTFSASQTIAQSSTSASTHATARNAAYSSVSATSSSFPSATYDYNKGLYSSADSDEGQISLPMLPNPSSSLTRSNKVSVVTNCSIALTSGANNGRRRKQNNIQGSTTSYATNIETVVNNRNIKLRGPNEDLVSSSITDSSGINGTNLLDQDDSAAAYDNSLVSEGNTFLSNYIPAVDPNEPVYCFCRQVSFGEMIGCDGENCPFEWYHIDCVGLSAVPEGRWYCDHCTGMSSQKKRKRGRPAAGTVS
ncbi:11882_t:CDS:2 [Rhizophagus irregularis]|nr:11882_t:CDS:2 [Rhizophagus irregularis]